MGAQELKHDILSFNRFIKNLGNVVTTCFGVGFQIVPMIIAVVSSLLLLRLELQEERARPQKSEFGGRAPAPGQGAQAHGPWDPWGSRCPLGALGHGAHWAHYMGKFRLA